MAVESHSGATVGRRARTTEQPCSRRNFSPSGAVRTRAPKIDARKKHLAHSCYQFPCARLRAHVKEASRCASKRYGRAAIGVVARLDPKRVIQIGRAHV